jgi:hypothetical protein
MLVSSWTTFDPGSSSHLSWSGIRFRVWNLGHQPIPSLSFSDHTPHHSGQFHSGNSGGSALASNHSNMQKEQSERAKRTVPSEPPPASSTPPSGAEEEAISSRVEVWLGCCAGVPKAAGVSPEAATWVVDVFASLPVVEGSTTDRTKGFSTLLMIYESAITISGSATPSTAPNEAAQTLLSETDLLYKETVDGHRRIREAILELEEDGRGGWMAEESNIWKKTKADLFR